MAFAIVSTLLLAVIARGKCDSPNKYNHNSNNGAASFGDLLKPPPVPLSHLQPVPFHGGASRSQRQNLDAGYHYQPPPPPPPPPQPSSDFKFPAPFYKQYNFNFVPPPQPFTTPSSSLFQKVSSWLFPSQETGSAFNSNSIAPVKKDCNPCNLVPWIPVIRYDLGAKNVQHSLIPTYGPPSPTAQNVVQFRPRPFYSQNQELPHVSSGVPHASYGPPVSSNVGLETSTYGPPSPTHTIAIPTSSTFVPSSSFPIQSSSYGSSSTSLGSISSSYNLPSSSYGTPSSTYGAPSSSNSIPSSSYGAPSSSYGLPSSSYVAPSSSYGLPSSSYGVPSSTYGPPTSTYPTLAPSYDTPRPLTSTYLPAAPSYEPGAGVLNKDLPQDNQVEILRNSGPINGLELPKVSAPLGFRNSYGEPISNSYGSDNIYPVSATAAESSKIRTEVLPLDGTNALKANGSLALAKPAPFTLNRGRNIHTLQPVALPNLSVSPLPPIFNARPFRPLPLDFPLNHALGINQMKQSGSNVKIEQSVPIAEYTHSIDYPISYVQSPVFDIDVSKPSNQSKAYRNIPNEFILDSFKDISSQASEDHLAATKSNQDASFESTGVDVGNALYESNIPADLKHSSGKQPSNHNNNFADLRGVKDEDVDKYRTDNNLQNIDSPLLYLKPGAPHKEYINFVISTTEPTNLHDYEIYDDISTTVSPKQSTLISAWDESRTDYSDAFSLPTAAQEDANKPRVVQFIIPYTTGQQSQQNEEVEQNSQEWISNPEDDYQARKVPPNTENYYNFDSDTESYSTVSTTTEAPAITEPQNYGAEGLNTQAILNDLYDVKEPPFDIIKLQHNIDDWTEQEFSKRYKSSQFQRTRNNGKYAKQIPDEYFTTASPVTNYLTPSTISYEFYDHEPSSSIRHTVTDEGGGGSIRDYNSIESSNKKEHNKNDYEESQRPHIYTAASSFRSTTTTPAPWGKIQTSISPLTKEKVYVVTSKPWTESQNVTSDWESVGSFESKKTKVDNDVSASDSLPFQSPRFTNRPHFASGERLDSVKSDSSYGFSRNWHQRINALENRELNNSTSLPEGSQQTSTNKEEDTHPSIVTVEPREDFNSAN